MFEYISNKELKYLKPKLNILHETDRKNLLLLLDYRVLAKKQPLSFNTAPLKPDHHALLCEIAPEVGHVIIHTSQGEKPVREYLSQYGDIPNTSLASNLGHLFLRDISSPDPTRTFFPIPGYEGKPKLLVGVIAGIHEVLDRLEVEYNDKSGNLSGIKIDKSEMGGAIIAKFEGKWDLKDVERFHLFAERFVNELGKDVASHISMPKRSEWKKSLFEKDNAWQTQVSIDLKPKGMNRSCATKMILSQPGLVTPSTVIVVGGDSIPGYPAMTIANELARNGKIRAAICAGIGRQGNHVPPSMDVVIDPTGDHDLAINQQYLFLKDILKSCPQVPGMPRLRKIPLRVLGRQ
jgi:hypothetical protein